MKKQICKLGIIILFFTFILGIIPQTCHAKKKHNVKYSVKNGVLTVYGKGDMPDNMNFKYKGKVKKIVVKKGITSIPMYAFYEFKKVKEINIANSVKEIGEDSLPRTPKIEKLTMPGQYKLLTYDAEESSYNLCPNWKTRIKNIQFNSPLSLKSLTYISSNNLHVWKKDKNYKSIKGVVYSKDGKSLVRVPANRKTVTVENGCEEFCTQAVEYSGDSYEDSSFSKCFDLKKIILPQTIKTVNTTKYPGHDSGHTDVTKIVIKTEQLDSDSLITLLTSFSEVKPAELLAQLSYVTKQNDIHINSRDSSLLFYSGTAEEVVIPEGVKKICKQAFYDTKAKKIIVPETVTELDERAFYYCRGLEEIKLPTKISKMGNSVFQDCDKLKAVTLPEGLTKVPIATFKYCTSLSSVTLPESITQIETDAFAHTSVPSSVLNQGKIKEIQNGAFSLVNWTEFILPASVEKVDDYAFSMRTLERVTISGTTSNIAPRAFCSAWSDSKETTLIYLADIAEWKNGGLELHRSWPTQVEFSWQKVSGVDGYQIQVSANKFFKKNTKTYYAKKEQTRKTITSKKMKIKYIRMRPYKIINGQKAYGKWESCPMDVLYP